MSYENQYLQVALEKIVAKYGSQYGITTAALQSPTLRPDAIKTIIANSNAMVEHVKQDLATADIDKLSSRDVEILSLLNAHEWNNFQASPDPIRKYISKSQVADALKSNSPGCGGFVGSASLTRDLSYAQSATQIGLDYVQDGTMPNMVENEGYVTAQAAGYYIDMPSKTLKAGLRKPVDPRIFQKMEQLGSTTNDAVVREAARTMSDPNVCMLTICNRGNVADAQSKMATYKHLWGDQLRTSDKILEPPYTGNGIPRYGARLEGTGYADVGQELQFAGGSYPPGSKLVLKLPPKDILKDPYVPAGSTEIQIGEWTGERGAGWNLTAPADLDRQVDAALAGQGSNIAITTKNRLLLRSDILSKPMEGQMERADAAKAEATTGNSVAVKLALVVKNEIQEHELEEQDGLANHIKPGSARSKSAKKPRRPPTPRLP
jgi:hypothetical protein